MPRTRASYGKKPSSTSSLVTEPTTATTTSSDGGGSSNHHPSSEDDDDGGGDRRFQAYTNEKDGLDVREDFMATFRPWHLLDVRRPWVLVPNGSFGGHFDWVPAHYRVGPWSAAAIGYWFAICYLAVLAGCYYYCCHRDFALAQPRQMQDFSSMEYPAAYSAKWWYHAGGCAWMLFIVYMILIQSPAGYRAWATYTVLSWTLLALRHGLCAALPWRPDLVRAVEWTRFPCALAHTVVFAVWNFVLAPYLYVVVLGDDPEKRRGFVRFFTSFRLINLHVVNLLLCALNVGWASPPRRLVYADLYVAAVWMILYMAFYLFVLDRLGVHLYPIFSPRVGGMVVASWTGSIALYLATFYGWRQLLHP